MFFWTRRHCLLDWGCQTTYKRGLTFAKWLSLGVIQRRLSPEDGQLLLNDSWHYSLPSAVLGGPSVYSRTDGRELRAVLLSVFPPQAKFSGCPKEECRMRTLIWVSLWMGWQENILNDKGSVWDWIELIQCFPTLNVNSVRNYQESSPR